MAKITLPVSNNVIWNNGHKASSSKFWTHGSRTGRAIDRAFNLIYVFIYAMARIKPKQKYTDPASPVRNFCMQKLVASPCLEPNCATQLTIKSILKNFIDYKIKKKKEERLRMVRYYPLRQVVLQNIRNRVPIFPPMGSFPHLRRLI